MRKLIIPIVVLLFLLSCQNRTSENFIKEISLNKDISAFVSSFIKSVDNIDCIYELYIDKKTEEEYFITVFSKPDYLDYFRDHTPLNYTMLNDKYVFIYTGLEDFIDKDLYQSQIDFKMFNLSNNKSQKIQETCSMVIKKDTIYIVEAVGLPFTDINFLPPIHVEED